MSDNTHLCSKCVSNHSDHNMLHYSELFENENELNKNIIKMNQLDSQMNNTPNSNIKELNTIKESYLILKNQITNILNNEISQIQLAINQNNKLNKNIMYMNFNKKNENKDQFLPQNLNIHSYPNKDKNKHPNSINIIKKSDFYKSNDPYKSLIPNPQGIKQNMNNQNLKSVSQNESPPQISDAKSSPLALVSENVNENSLTNDNPKSDVFNSNHSQVNTEKHNLLVLKIDKDINSIYTFDNNSNEGRQIKFKNFPIIQDSAIVPINQNIFICGGKNAQNSQTNEAFMIDLVNSNLIIKESMNVSRRSHTLVSYLQAIIFCAGGYNSQLKYLKEVEKYIIQQNKWIICPFLTKPRQDVSLCVTSNKMIYCFGGAIYELNKWKYLNTIEKFDLDNEQLGWKEIKLKFNSNWTPRVFSGVIQVSQDTIMIFGGFNEGHLSDVLLFNFEEEKVNDCNLKLKTGSSFVQRNSEILIDDKFIYAAGFPALDIHRYSFIDQCWKYLTSTNWFNFSIPS